MRGPIRSEWDQMREHDVLFLLSIVPPDSATLASWQASGTPAKPDQLYGLTHVRGCEVIEVGACKIQMFAVWSVLPVVPSRHWF